MTGMIESSYDSVINGVGRLKYRWDEGRNDVFTSKSCVWELEGGDTGDAEPCFKHLWKAIAPFKSRGFCLKSVSKEGGNKSGAAQKKLLAQLIIVDLYRLKQLNIFSYALGIGMSGRQGSSSGIRLGQLLVI